MESHVTRSRNKNTPAPISLRCLNARPSHAVLRLGAPPRQQAVLRSARGRALANLQRPLALHDAAGVVIDSDVSRRIVVQVTRARVAHVEVRGLVRRERLQR